jgi:hypothetical protein
MIGASEIHNFLLALKLEGYKLKLAKNNELIRKFFIPRYGKLLGSISV